MPERKRNRLFVFFLALSLGMPLTQVRHGTVDKPPNPFRISLGNSWVYTTFAIELETLR
jgi:hypothetical protein